MQTASQKCPAEKETRSLPQLPGATREEPGFQKDFGSSETLKVPISKSSEEGKAQWLEDAQTEQAWAGPIWLQVSSGYTGM